jgi:hypothetical protein
MGEVIISPLVASTYKLLGLQNNNDSRFAIVINKKDRAISDPALESTS